jgi:hypothetical protein
MIGTETYFELTYSSQSDIIGSCYGNLKKKNFISTTFDVLVSAWQNCDGPRLEYKKIGVIVYYNTLTNKIFAFFTSDYN